MAKRPRVISPRDRKGKQVDKIRINRAVQDEMTAEARRRAPLEACGLLGGSDGHVTSCFVLTNMDAAEEHFSMDPREQFAAIKEMRKAGEGMLAIWHSHPATPARLSDEDLRLAYTPDVAYVIVSLADAAGPATAGYRIDNGEITKLEIEIVEVPCE